jgi:hypothetical protein
MPEGWGRMLPYEIGEGTACVSGRSRHADPLTSPRTTRRTPHVIPGHIISRKVASTGAVNLSGNSHVWLGASAHPTP